MNYYDVTVIIRIPADDSGQAKKTAEYLLRKARFDATVESAELADL